MFLSNYKVYVEMFECFYSIFVDYVVLGEYEIYFIDECFLDLIIYEYKFDLIEYV